MTQILDVPDGYDQGIFAYHDLKIFIKPQGIYTAFFTGLHRHGGSAPCPLPGTLAEDWAYRVTVICYPNGPTMGGESRNPLVPFCGFDIYKKGAATQGNITGVLKVPSELRNRQMYVSCSPQCTLTKAHYCCRLDCTSANLARDGPSIQGPQALISTVLREVGLILNHVLAELRAQYPDYTIEVDFNRLFEAVSMVEANREDGETPAVIHPIPWANAPASDGSTVEFKNRLSEYRAFMDAFAKHTPFYFLSRTVGSGSIQGLQIDGVSNEEEIEDEDKDEDEDEAPQKSVSKRPAARGPCRKPEESTRIGQGNPKKRKAPVVTNGGKGLYSKGSCHSQLC